MQVDLDLKQIFVDLFQIYKLSFNQNMFQALHYENNWNAFEPVTPHLNNEK